MIDQLQKYKIEKHPAWVAAACALLIAIVGAVDFFTGYELSFAIFYLIPIAAASWFGGRMIQTATVIASTVVWMAADMGNGHAYSSKLVPYWNTGVRLVFFVIIVRLITSVRAHLAREKELARRDALTGLLNSHAFFEEGGRLMALAARGRHAISLAYLDLDDFKRVNDEGGHAEGDHLLRNVAQALAGALRSHDLVARLGGDEFALLLLDADTAGAKQAVVRLRERLADLASAPRWRISASIGLVTFQSAPPPLDEAVTAADQLMYAVKKAGKASVLHRVWNAESKTAEPLPTDSV